MFPLAILSFVVVLGRFHQGEARIQCSNGGCELRNYFGGPWPDRKPCNVATVFFPSSESELVDAVAFAVRHKHKIKVVSRGVHSHNKISCPDDGSGGGGVLISTKKYASPVAVDEEAMTVTADAGVGLRELIDQVASRGFALPHSTMWDGVSVSGMVSTGAHGSSLWGKGGGTHEYLVGIRIVLPGSEEEGFAKVLTLTEDSLRDKDMFNAARISLGVLGAVSKVTFALQPMFKRLVDPVALDDSFLEKEFVELARKHEFGEIVWFPPFNTFVFRKVDRVPASRTGEGLFTQMTFDPIKASEAKRTRLAAEFAESTANTTFFCGLAMDVMTSMTSFLSGYLNDGRSFTGFPVVGFNHKMQAAGGCQYAYENSTNMQLPEEERLVCSWDFNAHGSFTFDISISISLEDMSSFIEDMKQIQAQDPTAFCGITGSGVGFWLRSLKASEAYLGERHDAAHVEFFAFNNRDSSAPQAFEAIVEEVEQILLIKYNGMPHLGKNRPHSFSNIGSKVRNLAKFLEVRQQLDPERWFSSEFSDAMLGIRGSVVSDTDGCALEGLCICSEDRHCAPEQVVFCRPGIVYKEARVCKKEEHSDM